MRAASGLYWCSARRNYAGRSVDRTSEGQATREIQEYLHDL